MASQFSENTRVGKEKPIIPHVGSQANFLLVYYTDYMNVK